MPSTRPDVSVVQPDFSLKKKIGSVSFDSILTPDRIARAQEIAQGSKHDFLAHARDSMTRLDTLYHDKCRDGTVPQDALNLLVELTFSIKSNSGVFGYPLASDVARMLYHHLEDRSTFTAQDHTIISAHLNALKAIFHDNIDGDGERVGAELLAGLETLVHKYSKY